MNDERLNKLGVYFEHFGVKENWGVTFEQFIRMVDSGRWAEAMESNRLPVHYRGRLEELVF